MTIPKAEIGPDRLPPLSPTDYSQAQADAVARLVATPRGVLRGPFIPLLRSPELLDRVQNLGEFLRYRCSVPQRLRELAILTTAIHWRQPYEWKAHVAPAMACGIDRLMLEDIVQGRNLANATVDDRCVYDFVRQVHSKGTVSDTVWAAALKRLGEAGVTELVSICGYYALLAMVMNIARTPCPGEHFAISGQPSKELRPASVALGDKHDGYVRCFDQHHQ